MDRNTAVTTWREVCGNDTLMAMPPTGRMLEEFARRIEAAERERCAAWVDARRDAFCADHGSIDPETGTLEFGRGAHAEAKSEYVGELEDIAAGLRAPGPNWGWAAGERRQRTMNAELEGAALDAEVARCLGQAPYFGRSHLAPPNVSSDECWRDGSGWPIDRFSSDWGVAGPIIERERIELLPGTLGVWGASIWPEGASDETFETGPSALVAAMRALVRSKTPNV